MKSAIDNKTNQALNSNSNATNSDMIHQSLGFNNVQFNNAIGSLSEINVEDSLDDRTKVLVKNINEQFKILESNTLSNLAYRNYQDFELALEFIKVHTGNCIHFLSNISCKLINLNKILNVILKK